MDIRPRHWAIALLGAIALHGSALALLREPSSAETAAAAGLGGVEVSLGPAGAPSGSLTAASDVEAVEPVMAATAEATPVTPEEVPSQPVESAPEVVPVVPEPAVEAAEPVAPVAPVEIAELPPAPASQPAPASEAEVVEATPLPEPPPAKPEPPAPVAEMPEPPAPTVAETAPRPAPTQTAAIPGDAGKSGDTRFDAAGTGDATSGGGVPGAVTASYDARLRSWIAENHEFSRRLMRRKLYGETTVSFTINRTGKLLKYEIVASSGHELIDEAAIETLKRASPMPPMPEELPGAEYTRRIPIIFAPPG